MRLQPLCDVTGGQGGKTDESKGGPKGRPISASSNDRPAYGVEMVLVMYGSVGNRKPRMRVTKYDVKDGYTAPEQPGGTDGNGEVKSISASWMHPDVVDAVIACAKDAYRKEDRELARTLLEPYYGRCAGPAMQR